MSATIDGNIILAIPLLDTILIGPVSSELCDMTASDILVAVSKILLAYSNTVFPTSVRANPVLPLINKIDEIYN